MLKHERSHACFLVAVYYRPVDRRSASVLRQQRAVKVECAHRRHAPDNLRQHPERHDYLQVGVERFQFAYERFVLQFFRLHELQTFLQGVLLHCRILYLVTASCRLVRHGYHTDHIISAFYQRLQAANGELRRSHKYNPYVLAIHFFSLFQCWSFVHSPHQFAFQCIQKRALMLLYNLHYMLRLAYLKLHALLEKFRTAVD